MGTLLLRLAGPLQARGTTSRFDERDSGLEPSKSGVLGLVSAALGRDRSESVNDLAALRMGVRVDREGVLMRDYQTATGIMLASGKADKGRTVISPRFYLSDAAFLVGLEGDPTLLEHVHEALKHLVWPLALGRKSMPPGEPVWIPDGARDEPLRDALRSYPRIARSRLEHRGEPLRLMLEHASEGSVRLDQPVGPYAERRFGPRFVKQEVLHVSDEAAA
jgi:CRISPR system Cascade subunit CasD